ncbi:diacylglycerol kinase theta [Tachysurus ichikawai]
MRVFVSVCELHVHSDCAPFVCSDCRLCHQDGGHDYDIHHHHWREGNMASGARCDVCRRVCGSSDVLAGMRCEWCGVTAHASCYITIPPECGLGRLRNMILHPSCVRVCSRNFSKIHCYRISEPLQQCELDNLDDSDVQNPTTSKDNQSSGSSDTGKQTLRVFDGDDGVKRNQFRLVSIPRLTKNEEIVEAALKAFYIPDDAQEYELQNYTQPDLLTDDIINRNGMPDNKAMFKDCPPEMWLLRAKPRDTELLKIYAGWLKVGVAYISITIGKSKTVGSVIKEVLVQLGKQDENPADFNLVEVLMSSKQVQKQVLGGREFILDRLQEIRKTSLRQMNQTRFYIVESRNRVVQVDLLIGGLPLQFSTEGYTKLLQEHLTIKSQSHSPTPFYVL